MLKFLIYKTENVQLVKRNFIRTRRNDERLDRKDAFELPLIKIEEGMGSCVQS